MQLFPTFVFSSEHSIKESSFQSLFHKYKAVDLLSKIQFLPRIKLVLFDVNFKISIYSFLELFLKNRISSAVKVGWPWIRRTNELKWTYSRLQVWLIDFVVQFHWVRLCTETLLVPASLCMNHFSPMFHSVSPENVKKPKVFWSIQGV